MTTEPPQSLSYATPRVHGRSPRANWWLSLLRRIAWCVIGLVGFVILAGVASLGSGMISAWTTPTIILLLLIASLGAQRVRRRRAAIVVSYLEQAVRLNHPLAPWLMAAAEAERGALRRRLLRMVDVLRSGVDVADAIELSLPEATQRQVVVVRAAERAGRLRDGLARLVSEERRKPVDDITTRGMSVAYPLAMAIMVTGVMGLILIFVIPKYEQILLDFNVRMPWVTRLMIGMGQWLGLPLSLLAAAIFVLVIGRAFEGIFLHIPETSPPWRPLTDRLQWWVPVWRSSVRPRQLADLCDATAAAVDNGLPFHRALAEASCVARNAALRRRVTRWQERLHAGQPVHQAARDAGMPALMVGMLATASQEHHTADVLRFLARYYESRFSRLRALLHGAIIPVMVLIAGAFVLMVTAGLFMPLVEMMDSLTVDFAP